VDSARKRPYTLHGTGRFATNPWDLIPRHTETRMPGVHAPGRCACRQARRLLGLAETLEAHRGFADVIAALREGHGGTIGGTWGSASALAVAALVRARAHEAGKLVVVLPHAAEADDFVDDIGPCAGVRSHRPGFRGFQHPLPGLRLDRQPRVHVAERLK
jgi:hypothetical protein